MNTITGEREAWGRVVVVFDLFREARGFPEQVTLELRSEVFESVPVGRRDRRPDHSQGYKRASSVVGQETPEEGQCDRCTQSQRDVRGLDLVILFPDYT